MKLSGPRKIGAVRDLQNCGIVIAVSLAGVLDTVMSAFRPNADSGHIGDFAYKPSVHCGGRYLGLGFAALTASGFSSDLPSSQRKLSMFKRNCMVAVALGGACASANAAKTLSTDAKIRSEVAVIVAAINAKDIDGATKYDALDLISMESGRTPSTGAKADHDGLTMTFKYAPNWHLTKIDETVDVAKAGDMAVYRGTYVEDSLRNGVPFTHTGNYVAGFRHDQDGVWRVHWSVIAWQSPSHKK